eukprot:CAMPEP_0201715422 /NCGR_PEP_ID=MMETSP0593-20130828/1620_1 /ASSEMBLY_ACC=CAM_ASM_000672 /TAXON_ID=267983 /ORGANISM="Skeletonema japonicum, Strain CCMP2506" /LENGTH=309 /DNA_ID=CAMNT_0048204923 /DNA_START=53 /DNA_END=982 /DNA_ORIENTATION=+
MAFRYISGQEYIYRGGRNFVFPRNATSVIVIVHEDVTVIPEDAFDRHPNIVEVICHDRVEKIERYAFNHCRSLIRVIMPGVKIIEASAFRECRSLTIVECGKLEIIGSLVFDMCTSLRSINVQSVQSVGANPFYGCRALRELNFSSKLEDMEDYPFDDCFSLERITIPLKDGLISPAAIFHGCRKLNFVDLVERAVLQETITALQLEEWRNDMNEEVDSINQILPNTPAGDWDYGEGGKAQAIRVWIRSVLRKIVHYKAEHQRILDGAATTLQRAVPRDIMMNNVMPFLALPSHTFEGENGRPSRSIYW